MILMVYVSPLCLFADKNQHGSSNSHHHKRPLFWLLFSISGYRLTS
jgi:hypothetical protein